jgi:hypothetical protein
VKKASDFLCSSDELLEDAFGLTLFDWFRASPCSSDSAVCEWGLRLLVFKLLFKSTFAIGFNYNEAVSYVRAFNFHSGLVLMLPLLREKCPEVCLDYTYFNLLLWLGL